MKYSSVWFSSKVTVPINVKIIPFRTHWSPALYLPACFASVTSSYILCPEHEASFLPSFILGRIPGSCTISACPDLPQPSRCSSNARHSRNLPEHPGQNESLPPPLFHLLSHSVFTSCSPVTSVTVCLFADTTDMFKVPFYSPQHLVRLCMKDSK